jgi:hypothetical protein
LLPTRASLDRGNEGNGGEGTVAQLLTPLRDCWARLDVKERRTHWHSRVIDVRRTRIAITEAPLVPFFPAHCALLACDKVYPTLQLSAPMSLIWAQCLYRHCVRTPTRASGLTICVLLPTRASLDEGNEG